MTCPLSLSGNLHLFRTCSKQRKFQLMPGVQYFWVSQQLVTAGQMLFEYLLFAISYPAVPVL